MRMFVALAALLLSLAAPASGGNLLVNAGFETGDFSGWELSTTLWNCPTYRSWPVITGCYDPSASHPQTPSLYVHEGDWGVFLGYNEQFPLALLTQNVLLVAGEYELDFWLKQHLTWGDPNPNSFEVVVGPTGGTLSTELNLVDYPDTGWMHEDVKFLIPTTGSYTVGFRFWNVNGEWIVDDVNLDRPSVPEPLTLGLVALPICGMVIWGRRRRH